MLGQDRVRDIQESILEHSQADQTEVLYWGESNALTRFAESTIHQNVAETNESVTVRAVVGKRIGIATSNDLSQAGLRELAARALTIARMQPENADFESLPGPAPMEATDSAYAVATAEATPESRAEGAKAIIDQAVAHGLIASGMFSTVTYEIAIANSLGVRTYMPATRAETNTVIMGDDSSGYGDAVAVDVRDINMAEVGRRAVDLALRSRHPEGIDVGEYEVVLEPYAVADMLDMLSYMGFSGRAYEEGTSFMSGNLGKQLVGENVTIHDDGSDPNGLPMPFDFEGQPRQKVVLFDHGVARGVTYDSMTAHKYHRHSTGHALPATVTEGPFPGNVFMEGGDSSVEAMIANIKHGIYVTRFNYTNVVHPVQSIFTGMTRDGTFLIEDGKITRPLKNLRFTQSILEALSNVAAVGASRKLEPSWFGGVMAPALHITKFNFTGTTQF